jgi:hypothetical protein
LFLVVYTIESSPVEIKTAVDEGWQTQSATRFNWFYVVKVKDMYKGVLPHYSSPVLDMRSRPKAMEFVASPVMQI